jgi:hypothetical protein
MKKTSPFDGEEPEAVKAEDRTFEARYGEVIVARGIATIPSLLLRWQKGLQLEDGHVVLISTVFSFYRSDGAWPSVSIERMAKWRGVSWTAIEKEVKELERLGYLTRPGRDPKHGGSYFFDLTGLMSRLGKLASAEEHAEELRKAQARLLEGALPDLSTAEETNRDLKQKTEVENAKEDVNRTQDRGSEQSARTENGRQRPSTGDTNTDEVRTVAIEDADKPMGPKPVSNLLKYARLPASRST